MKSLRGPSRTIDVWDLPTRLFHWVLVLLFALLWVSGEVGGLDIELPLPGGDTFFLTNIDLHMWLGQLLLTLLVFRLLWGVWGSTTARFCSFVRGPRAAGRYIAELLRGRVPSGGIGHNPAGGWMVVFMLGVLLLQAITGLFANDEIFAEGPLAHLVSADTSGRLTCLHGLLFNVLLGAVALHVITVSYYLLRGKNLIGAMFSGRQSIDASERTDALQRAPLWRAVVLLAAAGFAVWSLRWL